MNVSPTTDCSKCKRESCVARGAIVGECALFSKNVPVRSKRKPVVYVWVLHESGDQVELYHVRAVAYAGAFVFCEPLEGVHGLEKIQASAWATRQCKGRRHKRVIARTLVQAVREYKKLCDLEIAELQPKMDRLRGQKQDVDGLLKKYYDEQKGQDSEET